MKIPDLQAVLLEAREKDGGPVHTVLPLPVHQSLSHRRSDPQQNRSASPHLPSCRSVNSASPSLLSSIRQALDRGFALLLCAVASDSTLVYQRMTDGLVTPDPPVGPFEDVGRRQHRKRRQQLR